MTSATEDPHMVWFIDPDSTRYSLKVMTGKPFSSSTPLNPPVGKSINPRLKEKDKEVPSWGWVVFKTLTVDIYATDKYGGVIPYYDKVVSTTITTNSTGYEPTAKILNFSPKPEDKHSYAVTAPSLPIPREKPPIISNTWWFNGQDNFLSGPTVGEKFWVADYNADKWSPVTPGPHGGIQQSFAGTGSRAYPILIKTGAVIKPGKAPNWIVSGGNGVALEGCWQIAIQIGSDGKEPWCETFYLAERVLDDRDGKNRHDLAWGPEYYSDGQGGIPLAEKTDQEWKDKVAALKAKKVPVYPDIGSNPQYPNRGSKYPPTPPGIYGLDKVDRALPDLKRSSGAYSREIDIMETRWTPEGPQINILNIGGNTAWNDDPDYGLGSPPVPKEHVKPGGVKCARWSDLEKEPLKTQLKLAGGFVLYGCLIRGTDLWLYAYVGDVQWYCTKAIPKTNKVYKISNGQNVQDPFVPYIGSWAEKEQAGGLGTKYNKFVYLTANNPMIAGKNPEEHPEFFGKPLFTILYAVNYGNQPITGVIGPDYGRNGTSLKIGPQSFVGLSAQELPGNPPWYVWSDAGPLPPLRPNTARVVQLPAVISFDALEGLNYLTAVAYPATESSLIGMDDRLYVVNYHPCKLIGNFVVPTGAPPNEKGFPLEIDPDRFVSVTKQQVKQNDVKLPWYVANVPVGELPAVFSFAPTLKTNLTAVVYPAK
jgi:hypothetical protein